MLGEWVNIILNQSLLEALRKSVGIRMILNSKVYITGETKLIFSYMWKNDRKTHASERNKNEDITFQQKYEFSSLFLRGLFDPYHDYLSLCTFVNYQLMLYVGMQ